MNTLDLLDRPIAFHRVFETVTGSINAALMLSQAIYWSNRTKDPDGWFYKSAKEWQDETGLTRHMQDAARTLLKDVLETNLAGMPATVHFRVSAENLRTWLANSAKPVCRKVANKISENRQPTNSAETTQETTTRNGASKKAVVMSDLPECLQTEEFLSIWKEWEQHRKCKRATLSPPAIKRQLKKLSSMGCTRAIAALDFTMEKGWTGIFENENGNGAHQKSNTRSTINATNANAKAASGY
jgi:hypothetical protein